MSFDFDYWAKLAKDDPARFEKERKDAIATLIASAPEHRQAGLLALQKEVDALRARESNPFIAAAGMTSMALDSMSRMSESLVDLRDGLADLGISLMQLTNQTPLVDLNKYK